MANTELAIFLLRLIAGVAFIYNGYPKARNYRSTFRWLLQEKFPLPFISTAVLAIGETLGGIFLLLGILTVPVAILLAGIMFGAVLFHLQKGEGWKGAEKAAILMVVCIAIALAGGGAWQVTG